MHDLNTIQNDAAKALGADNHAALVAAVTTFQAQGFYVLATYAGLMSIETFKDATEANAALSRAQSTASGSEHFALLAPKE